jgi:hypothetical protein
MIRHLKVEPRSSNNSGVPLTPASRVPITLITCRDSTEISIIGYLFQAPVNGISVGAIKSRD